MSWQPLGRGLRLSNKKIDKNQDSGNRKALLTVGA